MSDITCSCLQLPHKNNCPAVSSKKIIDFSLLEKRQKAKYEASKAMLVKDNERRQSLLKTNQDELAKDSSQNLISKANKSEMTQYDTMLLKSMALLHKARSSRFTPNKQIYKNATEAKLNLVTVNLPEENYLKTGIINLKEMIKEGKRGKEIHHQHYTANQSTEQGDPHISLKKLYGDETLVSESKTNGLLSPLESSGRIQVVQKRADRMKSSSCGMLDVPLDTTENFTGQVLQSTFNIPRVTKSSRVVKKHNRKFQSPLKRPASTAKQIFQTSDRISYGFNKIEPFSTKAKKSISEIISEAQRQSQKSDPSRRLIKANNYYLHNFQMAGSNKKSSIFSFRLNELLSEKRNLINKLRHKAHYPTILPKKHFEVMPQKKQKSSPVKMMKKPPKVSVERVKTFIEDHIEEAEIKRDHEIDDLDARLALEEFQANDYLYQCAMESIANERPNGLFKKNIDHILKVSMDNLNKIKAIKIPKCDFGIFDRKRSAQILHPSKRTSL